MNGLPTALQGMFSRQDDGCWIWTGTINDRGYGRAGGALAHRRIYRCLVGPIPEGLELDHLCRVTACVNPDHLEPVTAAENIRRRYALVTHCVNGHEFTPANTYVRARTGHRQCRTCNRIAVARYQARRTEVTP